MFFASVILLAATAGVMADEDPCARFLERGVLRKCCKKEIRQLTPETKEMFKECRSLPSGPESCEREMCIASKKGYTTPDGKLDISKIKEKLDSEVGKDEELAAAITQYCLDGDLSLFGAPDVCDATKLRLCMEVQLGKTCPEWSNDGVCEGLADLSVQCKAKYN